MRVGMTGKIDLVERLAATVEDLPHPVECRRSSEAARRQSLRSRTAVGERHAQEAECFGRILLRSPEKRPCRRGREDTEPGWRDRPALRETPSSSGCRRPRRAGRRKGRKTVLAARIVGGASDAAAMAIIRDCDPRIPDHRPLAQAVLRSLHAPARGRRCERSGKCPAHHRGFAAACFGIGRGRGSAARAAV